MDSDHVDPRNDGVGANPKAKLGEEVAAQMEAIEDDFGDDYSIGAVVTVVEVIGPEGQGYGSVATRRHGWGSGC